MGAEALPTAAVDPAQATALAQERLQFEGIDTVDLLYHFIVESGYEDVAAGRELGIRLMEHVGIGDTVAVTTPLLWTTGKDAGKPIGDLTLADYVNFAVVHHPEAVGMVLAILELDPEQDAAEYAALRDAMRERLNPTGA